MKTLWIMWWCAVYLPVIVFIGVNYWTQELSYFECWLMVVAFITVCGEWRRKIEITVSA